MNHGEFGKDCDKSLVKPSKSGSIGMQAHWAEQPHGFAWTPFPYLRPRLKKTKSHTRDASGWY